MTKRQLRILHVTAPAKAGGLETVVRSLLPAQAERGHDVALAAVVVPGDDAAERLFEGLDRSRVTLHRIELGARDYWGEVRALRRLARLHRASVMHTHGYRSDVTGWLAGTLSRLPRVTSVHGFVGGPARGRLNERIQRWTLRRFDAVVAVSEPLLEVLATSGIPRRKLHVVRNAWRRRDLLGPEDARRALGLSSEGFRLAWVGRLSREKGPDLALEALAQVSDPSVVLSMVGDGPMREELQATAARLGVADRVRFHGLVEDAGRLMCAFDGLLLSSHTEGTPMVLFEAMAAGVPIAATAVGGVPDVVGDVAELVAPDDVSGMAEAIDRLTRNPASARTRAEAGLARLRTEFSSEAWVAGYDRVYASVVPD